MVVNSPNGPQNRLDQMSLDELKIQLAKASETGNFDEAGKILDKIREKTSSPKDTTQELGEDVKTQISNLNDQIAKETDPTKQQELTKQKTDLLERFLVTDLAKYKTDKKSAENSKEKRLQDLQAQLNETYTTLPSLSEYLSRERRRLVTIHDQVQKFKTQDGANYPKNFLIYAMALTPSSLFGVRQKFNRGRIKMARRRKSDQIGEQLRNFENMLNTSIDDRSPRKRGLKNLLKKELVEAKQAYISKQRANIGLAA